jgi:hypothetical protein
MKMRLYLTAALACLAIATGWVAGCGSQSAPTGPTGSAGPSVTALTVKGNAALTAPGQTTQLTLEATLSEGSKKDVTSTAQWLSTAPNVVTVSTTGLAMAVDFGKASVWGATLRANGSQANVSPLFVMRVLPQGTYILSGLVTEPSNLSLADVRVETIGGPMSGRVVMTDGAGNYAFNGVSGVAQVRVTKDGYQPATQTVLQDTEHTDVVLVPSAPYASIAGIYSLTFTASPSCSLPDDASKRTYTATIDQRTASVTISLSDARFFASRGTSWNQISGHVLGNVVSLTLDVADNCFYYGGCVVEQLADNRYLTLTGTAQAVVTTPAELSAVFAGAVSVSGDGNGSQPIAACAAPDHHLVFTRKATTTSRRIQ